MSSIRKCFISIATAAVAMFMAVAAQATHYYVVENDGTGTGSGTLSVPFRFIRLAINTAHSGDTIHVAAGQYIESLVWNGKNLTILGAGINSKIKPNAFGAAGGRCLRATNLTSASRIDGFDFVQGKEAGGGGILTENSSLTISNCTFENNTAVQGGGIYNDHGAPTITNCTFLNNIVFNDGGAIYNSFSSPVITMCSFTQNQAPKYGGAIANQFSSPIVTNCTFLANTANLGGGMYIDPNSQPIVTGCTFRSNAAQFDGAGVYNDSTFGAAVTNCLLTRNGAGINGGGIFNNSSTKMTVTNCTIFGNQASEGAGIYDDVVSSVSVTNCIVWGNTGIAGTTGLFGIANITYSDVQELLNTTPDANGNFGADPLFVSAVNTNLHLTAASPCRDRGNNAVLASPPFLSVIGGVLIDSDTCRRLSSSTVDLGAYEFQSLTDVTSQISIYRGLVFPGSTLGSIDQPVIITNTGGTYLRGPISLILTGLSGYVLSNRTGKTSALTPAGRPYINLPGILAPGKSVVITLTFTRSGTGSFTYGIVVGDGIGTR